MGEAKWKAFIDGKKFGPVDEETIQRWIDEDRVTARTQVWCNGMTRWLPAAEVREFAPCFEATVAAIPALLDDPPAPAPKPEPAPAPAPAPRRPLVDHDAATVIQESPFREEELVPVAQSAFPQTAERRAVVAADLRPAQRPRPGLPLLPILLSLLALLPTGALVYVAVIEGDLGALPAVDRALLGATAFGLLLLVALPLLYNGLGLWGGFLGALVTLGSWTAFLARDLVAPPFTTRPRLLGLSWALQERFIEGFGGGFGVPFVATLLNWLALVVPFLALLYYAFTRKYRARLRYRG